MPRKRKYYLVKKGSTEILATTWAVNQDRARSNCCHQLWEATPGATRLSAEQQKAAYEVIPARRWDAYVRRHKEHQALCRSLVAQGRHLPCHLPPLKKPTPPPQRRAEQINLF